ncbi:MAG: hypothetical protein HN658_05085 [Rhodospirillales bacterium]|nr:hypothetical protein [Rhodospirillales bacterium]MBT4006780.1 hypothetical protein [Rhodospirillales bacterium]MBT5077272.1 hypothetical protein [Rhodospirillales bacterium]MBT5113691.1 hypothetical protein [Rhodospirillales bacterium]MBT5673996.1 hypothetical protein [Rhodospirillales bacterium]
MAQPATIIVHNIDHARAALDAAHETAIPIRLMSAPGAVGYAGCAWFMAMVGAARAEHPDNKSEAVMDCGTHPGHALGAIRAGVEAIQAKLPAKTREKIAAIANKAGVTFIAARKDSHSHILDLLDAPDPQRTTLDWLHAKHTRK